MCSHRDDWEQAEQNRRGAKDCFVRPLALGFYPEVSANFGKCPLDLPPADEPCENVAGASIEVGGEESLRLEFACRIANKKPADRHWRHAAAIPDGGAAGDFDEAVGSAVPETDAVALPGYLAILDDGVRLFQRLPFDKPAGAAFVLLRREVEQIGIEAQAGDDTDMAANLGKEFDGCKRAIGNQDNIAIGEPAVDLQGGLARPIEQCFGCSRLVGIETFGGGEKS